MSNSTKSSFLEALIGLLIQHFGEERVRAVLAKVSMRGDTELQQPPVRPVSPRQKPRRPTVANALESIRGSDPEKHRLLDEFFNRLKDRKILSESQDIRHFAQLIGLKEIQGKSRKDMIPSLMRFLLEQPTGRLQTDLQSADKISEQQRRQGFSVLTDKLLDEK
jgi:hypothetical protein